MSQNRKPQSSAGQMSQLIKKMDALTAALTRMAESNEQLVQALLADEGGEQEEGGATSYLSGAPIR